MRARTAWPLLALALGGCARVIDLRPYPAHPGQVLETEDVLVTTERGVRVAIRSMRPEELDEAFRLPGKGARDTGNPFITRPPHATARFTVFKVMLRNESDQDTYVEPEKMILRDDLGGEYKPLTRQELIDYWIGRVKIELGKPLTWTPQMDSVRHTEEKEKSMKVTVYEGGRLPARGEHAGYLAFRDLPQNTKRLQLLLEIVTRSSRYGNPLDVTMIENNFSRVKIPRPPKDEPDLDQWRDQ